jgi:hypothetical protein
LSGYQVFIYHLLIVCLSYLFDYCTHSQILARLYPNHWIKDREIIIVLNCGYGWHVAGTPVRQLAGVAADWRRFSCLVVGRGACTRN